MATKLTSIDLDNEVEFAELYEKVTYANSCTIRQVAETEEAWLCKITEPLAIIQQLMQKQLNKQNNEN